jgi:hypothetical protein
MKGVIISTNQVNDEKMEVEANIKADTLNLPEMLIHLATAQQCIAQSLASISKQIREESEKANASAPIESVPNDI